MFGADLQIPTTQSTLQVARQVAKGLCWHLVVEGSE